MDGYNVLFPMGYDAFGLPTENYAIKNHIHPGQGDPRQHRELPEPAQMLGYSFDWDREINTTDPATTSGPSGSSSSSTSTAWPIRPPCP